VDGKTPVRQDEALLKEMEGLDELQLSDHLCGKAREFIREHSLKFLQLRLNSWVYSWTTQVYWIQRPLPENYERYRLPLDPFILAFTAYALWRAWTVLNFLWAKKVSVVPGASRSALGRNERSSDPLISF